jgi:hypothetical protein
MPKLYVKNMETGEIVHELETTQSRYERVMAGMLINMDTDKFCIDDSEFD